MKTVCSGSTIEVQKYLDGVINWPYKAACPRCGRVLRVRLTDDQQRIVGYEDTNYAHLPNHNREKL
ncbi:hypothetical protein LCGC14_0879200 [marine sediment metagenome]|uniref:Uncharacterized protein n=1 Tax=marine sediment metagenome TaxID=412755 RepID=A0A0F9PN27_9ZZZZ